ncbi:MAG: hypothetical protein ACTSWN_13400 [Promethearchaeota archaeon]
MRKCSLARRPNRIYAPDVHRSPIRRDEVNVDVKVRAELLYQLDLLQLRLRRKYSERSKALLEFLKNRRKIHEESAKVMSHDEFMAVIVTQPTRTALLETLSLEQLLLEYNINPYVTDKYFNHETKPHLIINRIGSAAYNDKILKEMINDYFPTGEYTHTLVPEQENEVIGREMLEKIARLL